MTSDYFAGSGRPILVGVFHESSARLKLRTCGHAAECAAGQLRTSLAVDAAARGVIDRIAVGIIHRDPGHGGRIVGPPIRGGTLRWGRRSWQAGSTCPTASATASKLRQCLTGLERLLEEKRFDRPQNLMGLEIELNLAGADGHAAHDECRSARADREPRFPDRTRHVQPGSQHRPAPAWAAGYSTGSPRNCGPALAYADRKAGEVDARNRDDRHSADARRATTWSPRTSPTSTATPCSTTRSWPPAARTSSSTSTGVERLICTLDVHRARGRLHLRAAAPPGHPGPLRRRVERGAGASPPCRSRSAPTRPSCSAASCGASPGRRCSSRPPTPGRRSCRPRAYGRAPGSASAGSPRAYDLFEENLRYFPPLLPICDDEDPLRVLDEGGVPELAELVLHNGTVYRWNRPVYARRRRRAAPAGREPGAARRAHRHRRHRQRGLLLRPGARARRGAAPGLDAAAVRRRRRQLRRRLPVRHRRRAWTGPGAGGTAASTEVAGRATWSATNCCRWPRRGWTPGASSPPTGTSTSGVIEERCRRAGQRRVLAGGDLPPGAGAAASDRDAALAATTRRYRELMHLGRAGAHLAGGAAGAGRRWA